MKSRDIIDWLLEKKEEFNKDEFKKRFKLDNLELQEILNFFLNEGVLIEIKENIFLISEKAQIFKNKLIQEFPDKINTILKNKEDIQGTEEFPLNDWSDLKEIDRFTIFDGSERIYEIGIMGKKIRLEGKEILDYNIFRLRFFEEFGVLLDTYKGIASDWANLVNHWYKNYGEILKDKKEVLSDPQEAFEMIIDYINNCSISDDYVVREGICCVKEKCIFVPTKIIKKLLKRNNLNISMRKLAYIFNEYLISGSVPLKIENKSERFWKFKLNKFNIDLKNKLELEKEENA